MLTFTAREIILIACWFAAAQEESRAHWDPETIALFAKLGITEEPKEYWLLEEAPCSNK